MAIRFRGAAQVVVFNWPKVLGGVTATAAGLLGRRRLPFLLRAGAALGGFWTASALLVSWWVYDLSPLRRWRFVAESLPRTPERVLLVVAGFDEVSPVLADLWPEARIDVVDVVEDPEPSVRRARRWYPADAPVVAPTALAPRNTYDLVLMAESAHEVRNVGQRAALFASAERSLTDDGRIVVVEHLRDGWNFVAFGPGFWHFTTGRSWLSTFRRALLEVRDHRRITPFVHAWTLSR